MFRAQASLLLCLLTTGITSVSGQTSPADQSASQPHANLVELPVPLLPQHFGSWQTESAPVVSPALAQAPSDPTDTPTLKEDGPEHFATATYTSTAVPGSLAVTAMEFGDATGAFSAYTLLRKSGMHPTPTRLGTESVTAGDAVLLWAGTTVLTVSGPATRGGSLHDLQNLAAALPKISGRKGLAPLLPTLLPPRGLEPTTIHYALGPQSYAAMSGVLAPSTVIFNKSTEVITADYTTHAGNGTLTLLLCPTPQIAGDQGRAIEAQMKQGTPPGSAPGSIRLRRVGPLVAMTSGGFSPAEADALIHEIHLTTDLTWNKEMPVEFHAEVRKTASLLVSIATLSGVLMLAAVVLGLFFGGGRAAIRMLQGKPAYSEPEFLSINLRGMPKPFLASEPGPTPETRS